MQNKKDTKTKKIQTGNKVIYLRDDIKKSS